MLHKLTSSYREIAKYFPELKCRLSLKENYKIQLLDIASRKEPRPNITSKLGLALRRYSDKKSPLFDPSFRKEIKRLAPEWLVIQTDVANSTREKLLRMARKGEKKPLGRLGKILYVNTNKKCSGYNAEFTKEIKRIAPHWLLRRPQVTEDKKIELIKMARRGESKPNRKTPLGKNLYSYLCESSTSYDPDFKKKISKIAPAWTVTPKQIVCKNKELLLDMAKEGKAKPKHDTRICDLLYTYTSKKSSSYDPSFTSEIRKFAPDWLEKPSSQNKKILLTMAKNGDSKPLRKHLLGFAFIRYTYKKSPSYDPTFTKEIKRLAPNWLRSATQYEVAERNRKRLLEMARKGKPRPSQRVCRLGILLCNYLRNDPKFAKEIRKIRPDWFVQSKPKKGN